MIVAAAASALVLGLPGAGAQSTYANGGITLALHYEMTCGQPGPGPLTVQLPSAFRLGKVRVAGHAADLLGRTLTIDIPGPHGVTCMSITMGTLRVRISGIRVPAGRYDVKAAIRRYAFTAHLRVPNP